MAAAPAPRDFPLAGLSLSTCRLAGRRKAIAAQLPALQQPSRFLSLSNVHGLNDVGIRPELISPRDILLVFGRGEHDHHQPSERWLRSDPCPHFEARFAREFQVQQHEAGHGELVTIGIGSCSFR